MAKKGSAEVISSLYQHLITRGTSATHGIFWGDNTSSQLKNMFVMLFHDQLVRQDGGGLGLFDRVDAKVHTPPLRTHARWQSTRALLSPTDTPPCSPEQFGPPGHTFLVNDRAFGQLSQRAKKRQTISSTRQWIKLAKRARVQPRYHCVEMKQEFFRDWKTHLKAKYQTPAKHWKSATGEKIRFTKIRW